MISYYRNTTIVISGITLIALVVTIVVLLILAGITISLVFSENGIIAKAQEAANKTKEATINEQTQMNEIAGYMENMLNGIGESTEEPEPEPELPSDGSFSEDKGVNTPNLGEGMTPIKWDETANSGAGDWVETDGSDPDWYDYSAKKWANAKTSDGSMWVWIPRYAYSITSGYHSSSTGTIEVEFMKGLTNETATGRTSFNNASGQGNWNIHPAFNYEQTVSGIWVAKFEASQSDAEANSADYQNYTGGTSGILTVRPGVNSYRNISISRMFTICKEYNPTLNSHMMKNIEWGAVAYLAQSSYGKNSEITINSNSSYLTGGGSENAYINNIEQSTTGTIYGIYDLSGGADEYLASVFGTSSFLKDEPNYMKDIYSENYSDSVNMYGDALWETSGGLGTSNSWYGENASYPDGPYEIYLRRGGIYDSGSEAGIFDFDSTSRTLWESFGFRPVLVVL